MQYKQSGFDLLQIVAFCSLILLIGSGIVVSMNVKSKIDLQNDVQKKADLATLTQLLDRFHTDKKRYPLPSEICYDGVTTATTCNICGNEYTPPQFIPYMHKLPCDPQHDAKKYRYQVSDANTPQWYRIFAQLNNPNDSQSCGLCGPDGDKIYSYGVSSANKKVSD